MKSLSIAAIHVIALIGPASYAGELFALRAETASAQEEHGAVKGSQNIGSTDALTLELAADSSQRVFDRPQPLPTPDQYRMEAWVKTHNASQCAIAFVLYDAGTGAKHDAYEMTARGNAGRNTSLLGVSHGEEDLLPSWLGPRKRLRGDWRYIACDIPLEHEEARLLYNIEVTAKGGPVSIAGLRVVGAESILPYGAFGQAEPGTSEDNAIPRGWRRCFAAAHHGQEAEGVFRVEAETGALVTRKSDGVFWLSAQPKTIPQGTSAFVGRIFVPGAPGPTPKIVIRQYGLGGLLQEDFSGEAPEGRDEILVSTGRIARHPDANRLLFLLSFPDCAGEYRVRLAETVALIDRDPRPIIHVDQVGYDTGEPLRFIASTQVFPTDGNLSFTMDSGKGTHLEGALVPLGRSLGQDGSDWGSYYFEGVLPSPPPGVYTLEVLVGDHRATLESVVVGSRRRLSETAELAYRFYFVQRCGFEVPGWHGLCHMDDARLPDGTHVDVTGGYHNAGDFHKHTGDNTPVSVYAMIALYRQFEEFFDALDSDANGQADLLDEALWGATWLRKMVDPETGRMWMNVTNDIDYYGVPERDTDGRIGTGDDRVIGTGDAYNLAGFVIASWAALAHYVPDSPYLAAGRQLWDAYKDRIMAGHDPRHVISAIELYRATGEEQYRMAADHLAGRVLALQGEEGWFAHEPGGDPPFRIVDEGTAPAALACYALTWPESDLASQVKTCLKRYCRWSMTLGDNPFGIIRHYTHEDDGPFYFKSRDEWFGGSNSAYCSTAWAVYLAALVFDSEPEFGLQLRAHAANQVHWILGMNPLSLCMFEGKGNSDRIKYHHLYAEIPGHPRGAVPGALPNGIIREPSNLDKPWFDLRQEAGTLPRAESAEPWLPHNAYYLLMLSASR